MADYLAEPTDSAGPWPGVVVLHEAFGLNDDIRQQASKLAAAGYLALAPDLFTAGGARRCIRSTFKSLIDGEGDAFADIEACRGFMAGHGQSTGSVGVIGFCMGGGFALLSAARGFDAAAPNYGAIFAAEEELTELLRGACPLVASYGARDRLIPGHGPKLDRALRASGVEHDFKLYPEAGHSFLNRPSMGPLVGSLMRVTTGVGFHGPSAEDAWARILRFFDEHLGEQAAAAQLD